MGGPETCPVRDTDPVCKRKTDWKASEVLESPQERRPSGRPDGCPSTLREDIRGQSGETKRVSVVKV